MTSEERAQMQARIDAYLAQPNPHQIEPQGLAVTRFKGPCRTCHHYDPRPGGDLPGCSRVPGGYCANPEKGCEFWEREPGADDA